MGTFQCIEVSLVTIDDDLVSRVAERCNVTPERVRAYLLSDEQDDALLKAFMFFGVGPVNKFFSSAGK